MSRNQHTKKWIASLSETGVLALKRKGKKRSSKLIDETQDQTDKENKETKRTRKGCPKSKQILS